MRLTLIILFFFLFQRLCTSQELANRLQEIQERYNAVGMSVCIVQNNKPVFSANLGFRDIERNLPVTDQTVFRIASISKMVTVTALMQLYDQGKFQLNDDVSKYLGFELRNPHFPKVPITFSMLMSHTSGLRDGTSYDNFLMASYRQKPFPLIQSVVKPGEAYFSEDMWSKNEGPGFFTYANINFGLLGTLVEKLSGEQFDKYCIAHIFDPLEIIASFDVRDIPDINNIAVIYRKEDDKWVAQNDHWQGVRPPARDLSTYNIGSNAVLFAPQGGLRISAYDLAKFLQMHQNMGVFKGKRILSDSTSKRMHQVVWTFDGKNGNSEKDFFTTYALGCMRTDKLLPGVELLGHSGDAYGLLSGMYYSEKENFGIIFITNGGEWKPGNYSGWQGVEEDIIKACYEYIKSSN